MKQRRRAPAAPSGLEGAASPAMNLRSATPGQQTAPTRDQLAAAAQETQTPVLDAVEQEALRDRISGAHASDFRDKFGEPVWAVADDDRDWFRDRIEVVSAKTLDRLPKTYTMYGPGNLGHEKRFNGQHDGGIKVLSKGTRGGRYNCAFEDQDAGRITMFLVDYVPARMRKGELDRLRDKDGDLTRLGWLAVGTKTLADFVNVLNPASHFVKGMAGRKLDPFKDDFGEELSNADRFLELLTGVVECIPVTKAASGVAALSQAEKVAFVLSAAGEIGESVLDTAEATEFLSAQETAYARAICKLAGLGGVLGKGLSGEAAGLSDYLGGLAAVHGAGEEVARGSMDPEAFKAYKENHATIGKVVGNGDRFVAVIEELRELGL